MRTIELTRPKGLPKANQLCVVRTVQPDVKLDHPQWVRYHLVHNKKRF
jgi:hypothetical protein